ncbi:myoglobin-like [Lingula anatina]|uniref:Myoglobin-like n=1 Tax=Lingula anatina TaxID=7574 RepID=A0A1S3IBZ4_LINAN|nr:myoglobin-like [Lingula anatina]|eukprot:XP_013395693.1 myoglobin-like [Lingula anatina]
MGLAFLRNCCPTDDLLPEYLLPWEQLGKKAAKLMDAGELKDQVEKLPCLDYTHLRSYEEYCLAHSLLSTIAHCYVWQDRDKGVVPEVLPRAVAVPWYHVSQYLGLNPVYCYLACMLANWKKESEDSCDIELICGAPGTPHTDWFFIVSIQIEIDFGKGIKNIIKTYQALTTGDDNGLIEGLQGIADTIKRMQQTLSRMHEKQDPWPFYNKLRPFFEGWGAQSKFLPEGLIYEGVSDSPLQYLGGSAAQSSTIQTFDAILGVKHTAALKQISTHIFTFIHYKHDTYVPFKGRPLSMKSFGSKPILYNT